MEEMNEDEPGKAKKWKRDDNKDIDSEKEAAMEAEIKTAEGAIYPSGGPNEAVQGHAARERGCLLFPTWEEGVGTR